MRNLVLAIACFVGAPSEAVELGAPFSDGMVLQRGREVPVWGWSNPGERVEVSFAGHKCSAKADGQGAWQVRLPKLEASAEGRVLRVNEAEVKDVLVGEVWFVAGQSNAEFPIWSDKFRSRDHNGALTAAMTDCPDIRFCLYSNYATRAKPRRRGARRAVWKPMNYRTLCLDVTDVAFSAVGVYFAKEIRSATGIPVGIVEAAWGSTRIEAWTPSCGFSLARAVSSFVPDPKKPQQHPSAIWNEQVAPWTPMAMRGVLWYQGCTNIREHGEYGKLMHTLYKGWASEFANPGLRLYFVQLAPWGDPLLPYIQEQQAQFAREEPNAGMAVANDVGCLTDIHPHDKATVGKRLAAFALAWDYGWKLDPEAPSLKDWKVKGSQFVLDFDHAKAFNVYNEDPASRYTGFEVAGSDGVWRPGRIDNLPKSPSHDIPGGRLLVSAAGVDNPVKLRYLYSSPWRGVIRNELSLPVPTFHIGD